MKRLSNEELAFANFIVDGLTQSEAFRRAYPHTKLKGTALRVQAHKIAHREKVERYIAELRQKTEDARLLTRKKKREILCKIATDGKRKASERIEAIKTDNAMTGDNKPVRIEGEITLYSILKQIAPTTGLPSHDSRQS